MKLFGWWVLGDQPQSGDGLVRAGDAKLDCFCSHHRVPQQTISLEGKGMGSLILARTGDEPVATARTSDGADELERLYPSITGRYCSRLSTLRGGCFYDGG